MKPEIGFSDSALWPGNTNRKVKPVFGFNNEAQIWLQFSPRKFEKRDLASGHLQASDRSMISPWRLQQDSQPLDPQSSTRDTGGQGDGCGGWTSAGAHTRPWFRWTGQTFASNSAGQLSCEPSLEVRNAMWERTPAATPGNGISRPFFGFT